MYIFVIKKSYEPTAENFYRYDLLLFDAFFNIKDEFLTNTFFRLTFSFGVFFNAPFKLLNACDT